MGTSNDDVLKSVQYYQERLDRYALNKNEDKMLYVIKKLNKLPINTAHLESTGVGRTVNALKKHEGKVGESAKELVASWKDMVLREEKAAQENARVEPKEEDVDSVYSSDHEADNLSTEENDSHRGNHLNSSPRNDQTNDTDEEHVNGESKKHDYYDRNEICSETEPEVEQHSVSSPEEEKKSNKRYHSTDRAEDEKHAKHKSKKAKRDHHRYEDKYKSEPTARTARNEIELESSNKIVNHKNDKIESHESKRKSHDSKTRDDSSRSKSEKRKKENGGDSEDGRSQQRSDKKKSQESKSHSSTEKHEKQSRREKDNSGNKKDTSKKTDKKHKSHHHERDSLTKKASDHDHVSDSKNTSNKEKTKKEKNHKRDKETKSVDKDKIVNGIDSESGASFAEALGMCGPKTVIPSSKKKQVSSSSSDKPRSSVGLESDHSAGGSTSGTSKNRTSSGSSRSEPVQQETVPELLREKELEPLNINISSLLPEITPNYRPLGVSLDLQPKRAMTDDEALSRVMSNRNQRTKVYSGNKSYGKVESLFQICVKILQDNIDALEYTGGVPYSILKPILERATPDQLFNMEHHNPYLIEDTDDLWLLHCQKEFRTRKRDELESWRDMYMRCLDEREARLNAITANIKQSQDKSIPIRTTKLAYVDSIVKPPRNIARQQVKNGIFDKKTISATAKLSAIAKSGEAGKISVPNPGNRAGERSSGSTAAIKPKKAPLMAKTLSYLKNRFKR